MSPETCSARVEASARLSNVLAFGSYFTFLVSKVEMAPTTANTLDAMMARSRQLQLPAKKTGAARSRKDGVYNQIIDILRTRDLGWPGLGDVGARFVSALTDIIWKVSPASSLLRFKS